MTSVDEYVAHGWALVPIPANAKGPRGKDWNTRERCVVPPTWRGNVGLAHAYSGTCALDIDDLEMARAWLAERNVDLEALLSASDAVRISSGRPNRAKLLYSLPEPLPSKKVTERIDGELHSVIDFRCATRNGRTVQDVLPPSIHPDTKQPYEWRYADELVGDWRSLPAIPEALLAIWRGLTALPDVTAPQGSSDNPYTLEQLREMVMGRDPDCDRDSWIDDLAVLHWETGGSPEGLELAIDWSSRGTKYKGRADVERCWRPFRLDVPNPKTAASWRVDVPATADDFDVIEAPSTDVAVAPPIKVPALNLDTDEDGAILASKGNLQKALGRPDFAGSHIVLDTFRDDILIAPNGTDQFRPLKDTDYDRFGVWLEFNGFRPIPYEALRRSVALVADDQRLDSAQQWLDSLQWDGVPRIERFLIDYFGTADTPYTRAVALYWWTAHAGRVLEPGCKADMVPILVGPQGIGKSTGVAAIAPAPENFVEVQLDEDDDEIARRIRGCLVAEIGELRGLQSRESESIKAMITKTADKWTPKYVERAHTVPRRLVFVGTTNSDEFLADETGNRRWLPVRVGAVRVAAIREDRLQLWAEARDAWLASGVAFGAAETLARGVHDAHMVHDVWEENVTRFIEGGDLDEWGEKRPSRRETPFAMSEVLVGALGLELKNVTMIQERRVGKILRALGFEKKDINVGGKARKLWVARGCPSDAPTGNPKCAI